MNEPAIVEPCAPSCWDSGKIAFDLKKEPGQMWIGIVRPLAMRYGVLDERRLVIAAAIPVLLPQSKSKASE